MSFRNQLGLINFRASGYDTKELGKYNNITLYLHSKEEDKIAAYIDHMHPNVTLWVYPNNRIKLNDKTWITDGKLICSGQMHLARSKYGGYLHQYNQFIDIIDINSGDLLHRITGYGLDSESATFNNEVIEAKVITELGYEKIRRWDLSGTEINEQVKSTVDIVKSPCRVEDATSCKNSNVTQFKSTHSFVHSAFPINQEENVTRVVETPIVKHTMLLNKAIINNYPLFTKADRGKFNKLIDNLRLSNNDNREEQPLGNDIDPVTPKIKKM